MCSAQLTEQLADAEPAVWAVLARNPDLAEALRMPLPTLCGSFFRPSPMYTLMSGHVLLGTFGDEKDEEFMLLNPLSGCVTVGGYDGEGEFTMEPQRTFHVNESYMNFVRSVRLMHDLAEGLEFGQDVDLREFRREARRRLERIERGATDCRGFWGHYLKSLSAEVSRPRALVAV